MAREIQAMCTLGDLCIIVGEILDSWGFGAVLSLSVHNQCADRACIREINSPSSHEEVVNPTWWWCSSQA